MKYKSAQQLNKPRGWIYGARFANYPCEARACIVTIGIAPSSWWCFALAGQDRKAVSIKLDKDLIYLDNEDGKALQAVLNGTAGTTAKLRYMPAYFVKEDPEAALFYKAKL